MREFDSPLKNVKIAAPCSADWYEMHGDNRRRFCAECKLNVYNLSAMTQVEAESFLINSEESVCVRFYRRRDGTVLTRNCPVGWQRVKKRISRAATAVFSGMVGFFGGIFGFNQIDFDVESLKQKVVVESNEPDLIKVITGACLPVEGRVGNLEEIKAGIKKKNVSSKEKRLTGQPGQFTVGRVENTRRLEDEPVVAWIK